MQKITKICEKHGGFDGRWGRECPACMAEREALWREEQKEYITYTEAKKILKNLTKEHLKELLEKIGGKYVEYIGMYGPVLKVRKSDIMKISENYVIRKEKTQKEIIKQKIYYFRKKARDKLSFFCPLCNETIRPPRDSQSLEGYIAGRLSRERALELIKNAHIRHEHTDYDDIRANLYEKYRKQGYSYEDASYEAWKEAREMIKKDLGE